MVDFVGEALKILESARERNIFLRMLGASAFRVHCPAQVELHKAMGRELTDVDFAAYGKQEKDIERMFEAIGYDTRRAALTPGLFVGRSIFFDREDARPHVDVFFDRLNMCHVVEFRGRLDKDFPTIPLAELVLEKTQIVRMNDKDYKDLFILFLEHPVGSNDDETVNEDYIANVMSGDWGFYYTTTENLKRLQKATDRFELATAEQRDAVAGRVDQLLAAIEKKPKSVKWKLRARVGTKIKWYNDVEEVDRAEHLIDE